MTPSTRQGRSETRPTAFRVLALAVLVGVLLTRAFLATPVRIASDSMAPTLNAGEIVLVWRWDRSPQRDDLVTFTSPEDGEATLKRAVAVGGDTVEIADALLYVNDELVEEPRARTDPIDATYYGPITVPPDHVLVLSDNRDRAIDSRAYGPVPVSSITGRVGFRLWPLIGNR